jgi:HEAT repeat protein
VPELILALEENDYAVRTAAAAALGSIGEQAIEAVPGLIELLDDHRIRWDEKISETALASLRKITGQKFTDQAAWQEWWKNRP